MRRIERLHVLTELLRRAGPAGRGAAALAAELGVSTRTVKRDLAALASAGEPVWSRPGVGGGYGLADRTSMRSVSLTAAQALALNAAVAASSTAPYADSARAGMRQVLDRLDPATRRTAEQLGSRVWVNLEPSASRPVLSVLEQAMIDQVVVRIRYADRAGAVTRRDVEPMIFALNGDRWFLVAWCRLREAIRWFELHRVLRADATRLPCAEHDIAEIGAPPAAARPVSDPAPGPPARR